MSIEIEVLSGNASWPVAAPLLEAVWPPAVVEKQAWGHIEWAHADLRVLVEASSQALACHVGIHFRTITWNGRQLDIGGIGGVATHPEYRRQGLASIALSAAIQTLRDHEALHFALLFCEPHNVDFYRARNWHPFTGEVYAEQPGGRIRFDAMAPFVFDLKRGPRDGVIDLRGLPW